jgi:hypothetical protein
VLRVKGKKEAAMYAPESQRRIASVSDLGLFAYLGSEVGECLPGSVHVRAGIRECLYLHHGPRTNHPYQETQRCS